MGFQWDKQGEANVRELLPLQTSPCSPLHSPLRRLRIYYLAVGCVSVCVHLHATRHTENITGGHVLEVPLD